MWVYYKLVIVKKDADDNLPQGYFAHFNSTYKLILVVVLIY